MAVAQILLTLDDTEERALSNGRETLTTLLHLPPFRMITKTIRWRRQKSAMAIMTGLAARVAR